MAAVRAGAAGGGRPGCPSGRPQGPSPSRGTGPRGKAGRGLSVPPGPDRTRNPEFFCGMRDGPAGIRLHPAGWPGIMAGDSHPRPALALMSDDGPDLSVILAALREDPADGHRWLALA